VTFFVCRQESGRVPPYSKTPRRPPIVRHARQRFGVRQPSGALTGASQSSAIDPPCQREPMIGDGHRFTQMGKRRDCLVVKYWMEMVNE
jgi:hypothetical protein